MPKLDIFKRRTQPISKTLIRQHLQDSDVEDDIEYKKSSPKIPTTKSSRYDSTVPRCASAEDLLSCKSWLDQLCEHEQARIDEASEDDGNCSARMDDGEASRAGQRQCSYRVEGAVCPPLDSAVLQRIREGRGPRDTIPEDLLAAFRDNDPQNHSAETYGDLRKVLLSWNDRMSGNLGEDQDAREMLQIAVERRTHLLKSSSHGLDRTHALKESSNELLQALTTLRPEIASFRSQDPFDILIMMWANVRIAIPDLDDELKLLTMKALLNEVESRLHTSNATKVFGLARSLSVARLEQNTAAVERLETKIQAFEQKMRETIVKKAIDRIKLMRKDLLQGKLKELQQLTELQAAQKWDAHAKLGGSQQRQNQSRAYDQANGKLRRVLQQQVPELDAHVQVVQNNANALAGMSASLLSRAMEAGFSLEDKHSSTLVELAKADVKGYVSGTVADVLDAREEAARMLNRMGAVESHLDVLLDAAKSQYREYDGLLRLLDPTESRNTSGDVEIELAEKYGPRRESILLMIRNMQRARRG